jgi:myo-inositol-hexaphosphate 3-phosphohydrolase
MAEAERLTGFACGANGLALHAFSVLKDGTIVTAGAFGSTEETDGIALATGSFGADYPEGLLVVQDGVNAPAVQNFKLVSWGEVSHAVNA